jgi:hypothetical protein
MNPKQEISLTATKKQLLLTTMFKQTTNQTTKQENHT